jgi:hypothetical protein
MPSRSWLLLTVPVALAAIALLSWTIASLLRTVRGSVIATVPIRPEQRVDINSTGDFAINIEGPLFVRRPTNFRFALSAADSDARIALYPILLQTDVTSMSRSRMELYSFTIASAGTYKLHIDGVDPSTDYSRDAIVITRQFRGALVLHVLALIACSVALIGSLVVSGLVLSGKSFSPQSPPANGAPEMQST